MSRNLWRDPDDVRVDRNRRLPSIEFVTEARINGEALVIKCKTDQSDAEEDCYIQLCSAQVIYSSGGVSVSAQRQMARYVTRASSDDELRNVGVNVRVSYSLEEVRNGRDVPYGIHFQVGNAIQAELLRQFLRIVASGQFSGPLRTR